MSKGQGQEVQAKGITTRAAAALYPTLLYTLSKSILVKRTRTVNWMVNV